MRRRLSSILVYLLFAGLLPAVIAPEAKAAPNNKATICHRTKSISNPYRLITVSRNSISGNNGHAGHKTNPTSGIWTTSKTQGQTWEDIIPGDLNWSVSGAQDIYYGRTKTASGVPACRSMTFSQFYQSEKAAGQSDAQIAADLDDGMSDEDKAILKTFGGSSCTTFAGCSTPIATISTNSKVIAAVTTFATNVTATSATLNGYVKTDSNSIRYYFEYSTDGTWATEPTKVPSTSAGPLTSNTTTAVTYNLTGLTSGTTYYYRIIAEYTPAGGTLQEVSGDLVSFEASNTVKYVIRYDANGGTDGLAAVDNNLYPANTNTKVLANYGNLTKNGGAFTGWSLSPTVALRAAPIASSTSASVFAGKASKYFSPLAKISFLRVAPSVQYTNGTYSGGNDITVQNSDITLYAQYETTYSVTYYGSSNDSGSVPTDGNAYANNASVTVLGNTGTLVKAGYTFGGWCTTTVTAGSSCSGTTRAAGSTFTITSNTSLYAIWTANTLTVTYNSQGGTSISSGTTTTGGSISSSPGTPTYSGHTFNGWFTGSSGGSAISFPYTHGQTSNFTLYAQWTTDTYTVTYNGNSNDGGTAPGNQTKTHDVSLTLATNSGALTKSGFNFNGWNTDPNGNGTNYASGGSYTLNQSITLYAKWTLAGQYSVTYVLDGGSGTTPTEADKAANATFATASGSGITKTGYNFSGWNDGSTTYQAGVTYTMPSSNVTFTAQWTAISYTITYDGNGNTGGSAASPISKNYSETHTVLTVGTLEKTGNTFTGWNTNSDGTSGTSYASGATLTVAGNVTLYAVWSLETYVVSYNGNSNDGGSAPSNQSKSYNVNLTLATNSGSLTKSGYSFNGWNSAANGSGTSYASGATYSVNAALVLYAQWTANSSGGGGGGGGSPAPEPIVIPKPVITSLSRSLICTTGFQVNVLGTGLSGGTAKLDGVEVPVISNNGLTAVVNLPASAAGKKTLEFTTTGGTASIDLTYQKFENPVFAETYIPYMYQGGVFALLYSASDTKSYRLVGNLPEGLSFNPVTGSISGSPMVEGVFSFSMFAVGDCGETEQKISLDIDKAVPKAISHRIYFSRTNSTIPPAALENLERFLNKVKEMSPRYITPQIYITTSTEPNEEETKATQLERDRYQAICEGLIGENIDAEIILDVFSGDDNMIEIIAYWPNPS